MKITVSTVTNKATGEKFEVAAKLSWNNKYFTCGFDHKNCAGAVGPWFPKLSEAYSDAKAKGYLELA